MATYSFEAEPRVVSQRTNKYKEQANANLMHNSRIYRGAVHSLHNIKDTMTPQEKEAMDFEKVKEEKQKEMMKTQLDNFKRSKVKQTPYDIRPAATARIEVDLSYFLTDQRSAKPPDKECASQSDDFQPRPPSPPYIPKKTGLDVSTQVQDGELFDFNYEVQPILNVVINKTLEQAQLEVEEEYELEAMRLFKKQYLERRKLEEDENMSELRREEETIDRKNKEVERRKALYARKESLIRRLQSLSLSKTYLLKLVPNAMDDLYALNVAPEVRKHQLKSNYVQWLAEATATAAVELSQTTSFPQVLFAQAAQTLLTCRRDAILQHKKKAESYKVKCLNMSKDTRFIRVMLENNMYGPRSEFNLRLESALTGVEYMRPRADQRMVEDAIATPPPEEQRKEDKKAGKAKKPVDVPVPMEEEADVVEPPKYKTLQVDNFKKVSFAVANDPYNDTPKDRRKYGFYVELYTEEGRLIEALDVNSAPHTTGLRVDPAPRDRKLKYSDDEKVVLALGRLPAEVHHVFFYIRTVRSLPDEMKFAWFRLCDYQTSQEVDWKRISKEDFEDTQPLYLCYRLYRQEFDPRPVKCIAKSQNMDTDVTYELPPIEEHWLLDLYRLPVRKQAAELSALVQSTLQAGRAYTQAFLEELKTYRRKKIIEDIMYKKKSEEQDSKKKKKPKKTVTKSKAEPVKMRDYQPEPEQIPTQSFGPLLLSLPTLQTEDLYAQFHALLPVGVREKLTEGWVLKVKSAELSGGKDLLRARTLWDVQVVARPQEVVKKQEEMEEEVEEAD